MSAATSSASRPPRAAARPATLVAAGLVLIALAALAVYAMFSGPTTVQLPAGQRGAQAPRTAPAAPADEGPEGRRER
jgi:hypothetical protein